MVLLTIIAGTSFIPAALAAADAGNAPVTENQLSELLGALVVACGIAVTVTLFITNKLSKNRGLTYQVRDQILIAIEDLKKEFQQSMARHDREDDDRFDIIHREIFDIHLRNAVKDNTSPPPYRAIPRRRHFQDAGMKEAMRKDPLRFSSDVRLEGYSPTEPEVE